MDGATRRVILQLDNNEYYYDAMRDLLRGERDEYRAGDAIEEWVWDELGDYDKNPLISEAVSHFMLSVDWTHVAEHVMPEPEDEDDEDDEDEDD